MDVEEMHDYEECFSQYIYIYICPSSLFMRSHIVTFVTAVLNSGKEPTFASNPKLAKVDAISSDIEEDLFKDARNIVVI